MVCWEETVICSQNVTFHTKASNLCTQHHLVIVFLVDKNVSSAWEKMQFFAQLCITQILLRIWGHFLSKTPEFLPIKLFFLYLHSDKSRQQSENSVYRKWRIIYRHATLSVSTPMAEKCSKILEGNVANDNHSSNVATMSYETERKVTYEGVQIKSLAWHTSRCHRTESIVSLERGVYSCAELEVFSC